LLQGSYRRSTGVRPEESEKADVDVIVVTSLDKEKTTPDQALKKFVPFLDEHYKGKYEIQGRSIGIELSYVKLDLVPTATDLHDAVQAARYHDIWAAASRIQEDFDDDDSLLRSSLLAVSRKGFNSPLFIPDREVKQWVRTHPVAQIAWTMEKNAKCNTHYINVVKAIKWWRRVNHPTPEHPKSYPLEHIVGDCCPDNTPSVAKGVTEALEEIADRYKLEAMTQQTPFLADRGVPEHDVLKRVDGKDFAAFYEQACDAAKTARKALEAQSKHESAELWRKLFGKEFPEAPPDDRGGNDGDSGGKGGYTKRDQETRLDQRRFA